MSTGNEGENLHSIDNNSDTVSTPSSVPDDEVALASSSDVPVLSLEDETPTEDLSESEADALTDADSKDTQHSDDGSPDDSTSSEQTANPDELEESDSKSPENPKKTNPFRRIFGGRFMALKIIATIILLAVIIACIVAFRLCHLWLQDLPDHSDADAFNTIKPTDVYANDRATLIARFQLENRVPLDSLDLISPYVVEGTVATEDERYYKHNGFDLIGIGRAVMNNFMGGTLEGASTITQQLVRNTVLADEMTDITYKRKVREIYLATKLEEIHSKEEILLLYLNTINYGGGAYGIEAAAKRYYSKSSSELSLNEAATLIGIPQSPTYNCPLYYPENTRKRRDIVLDRMVTYGCISQEEADAVKEEDIVLNVSDISTDGFIMYPYFGSYVRDQLLNSYDLDTATLFQGGLTVYTTLDIPTQDLAEDVVDEYEDNINDSLSIAMTCVDPDTGFVKAMVGGKDFYENQWNLAAQAKRQPGSSFKTFTLVTALEQGISPSTSVSCSSGLELNGYKVENIGGAEYGTRSISSAFAVSSNTGFVRLCAAVGPENVVEMAQRLGVRSSLDPVMSVTLGSEEVTTLDMAGAYATIASGGVRRDAVVIEQVYDKKDNLIIDHTLNEGEQVISIEVACAAINVMKGVISGGTGGRARLYNGQPVAGKTGTSENSKDSWFCGITPQLSVAVWIGDPDNSRSVSGLNGAAVFGTFMNRWLEGREIEDFPSADDPAYTRRFSNTDLDVPGIISTKDPNDAPDLEGLTIEEALKRLKGYKYTQEEEYSDSVAEGRVVRQYVSGNKVVVVISKGKDPAKAKAEEEKKKAEADKKKEEESPKENPPDTPSTGGDGNKDEGSGSTGDGGGSTSPDPGPGSDGGGSGSDTGSGSDGGGSSSSDPESGSSGGSGDNSGTGR